MSSYLIKDTTREERIKIIERSLNTCGTPCEDAHFVTDLRDLATHEIYISHILTAKKKLMK